MRNRYLAAAAPAVLIAATALQLAAREAVQQKPVAAAQLVPLFNGKDLAGWKIPAGDNGHWKVVDGVIDYDAQSEAKDDKNLWSEKEYGDFVLRAEWRIKETPYTNPNVTIVMPDGSDKKGVDGKTIRIAVPDSDSGIY